MAGKPKLMSQVKQLLRMYQQGMGIKSIARALSISKNTVKQYLQKVEANNWKVKHLLEEEEVKLEQKFHPGNPAYMDDRYDYLKAQFDFYVRELEKTGVTKQLLWEEYREVKPNGYGRSQFCHHLNQYLKQKHPSMVLNHQAGDQLFIDFAGKTYDYIDRQTGEIISCSVFVACLPFSDYGFCIVVPSQKLADFLFALRCCFEDLNGVPQALVPDNLKSAITKSSRYEPEVNRALADFANHYGCSVVPARVMRPKDKALVENHVKLIYTRVFARLRNRQFFSIEEINQAIKPLMLRHNQTRMQLKPYSRQECFLSEEQPLLKPINAQPFEIKHYNHYKVAKNNHILLGIDKHYYSVPYQYIEKKVKVIFTRSLVKIFHGGQQIAAHPRDQSLGKYSTIKDHLCSAHQFYLDRSPAYYQDRAKQVSASFSLVIKNIFAQDKYPEQLYRSCDGLLYLSRKTEAKEFEMACQIAISNQVYSYGFIANLINNKMAFHQSQEIENKKLPSHDNIRGGDYFQ